jgi:23S rRNA (guanosine2251-2'-O)-methyltransferase
MRQQCFVILDNVRSVHNVGSIFRTCDAAGVGKLYLCGYTPTPLDRFGRKRSDLAKVALGAETVVPWESQQDTLTLVQNLQSSGVSVVVVEQTPAAHDYATVHIEKPCAFVFGSERGGVARSVCDCADLIIHIPMHGSKDSLNVSVAVGVVLFGTSTRI